MHPCPWLLKHLFHASMSMVAAGELAHGSTFLAGACCAGAAAAGLLSPDPFFALVAFFSFLGAASFFLPKISLYFLPSNLASLVHMLTLPMIDLNSSWLTQVRNHLLTLGYWLRKESTITCL